MSLASGSQSSREPASSLSPLLASLCPVIFLRTFLRRPESKPPTRVVTVPHLPQEIYLAIVSSYIDSVITSFHIREYRHGKEMLTQSNELIRLMLVSKPLCQLVCSQWNRYWPVSATGVRMLVRPIVFFELFTRPVDLLSFVYLRFASLDFRYAFRYRGGSWDHLPFLASLPSSLEEIEVLWAHVSECEAIDLIKKHCPRITTLRIVPCTMFNNPGCTWWSGHQLPGDHNHYLKGNDPMEAKTYAKTIASGLQGQTCLKNLHLDHIYYHQIEDSSEWVDHIHVQNAIQFNAQWSAEHPNIPAPNVHEPRLADRKLWMTSCPRCVTQWSETAEHAERLAASVLKVELQSLGTVSFSSFVDEQRTSPNVWEVLEIPSPPSPNGEKQVWIRTKRPGAACSTSKRSRFRQSALGWDNVD